MKKFLSQSLFFIAFLVFTFAFTMSGYAQNPQWQQFTHKHIVFKILEEGDVLWFGTHLGLVKIDRATGDTTYYNTANSGLPANRVDDIAFDSEGNKWIGTSNGLAKFDGEDWEVFSTTNSLLPSEHITAVEVDNNNVVWAGTWNGLASFDGTSWTAYNVENSGLIKTSINALKFDTAGNLWVGYSFFGVAKFDGLTAIYYNNETTSYNITEVMDIDFDSSGNLWLGGVYLHKFDGSTWTEYTVANSGLPNDDAYHLDIRNGNEIWIGTLGGLALFNQGTWTVYPGCVNDVLVDYTGKIWISSVDIAGVCSFEGSEWDTCYLHNSPLPDNAVNNVISDQQGNIWSGTIWGGLSK